MTPRTQVVTETQFDGLGPVKRGKVRDIYDLGEHLLIVATDRLSAFDVIMPQGIPFKGKVLTQISDFWFERTRELVRNHVVTSQVDDFPASCKPYREQLRDRSMLVRKCRPLPIECVVRGYLAGSGWQEYRQGRAVCGISLPEGLVESSRLPEPIFTPATKEELGQHDENISFDRMASVVGKELAARVRDLSLKIYNHAAAFAETRGIIIADTKMEFGQDEKGELILIDELLTPDSSRFWPKDRYEPGGAQSSFDKQFVRDYLLSINFNKRPPGPTFPDEVIRKTSDLYLQALELLSGKTLA